MVSRTGYSFVKRCMAYKRDRLRANERQVFSRLSLAQPLNMSDYHVWSPPCVSKACVHLAERAWSAWRQIAASAPMTAQEAQPDAEAKEGNKENVIAAADDNAKRHSCTGIGPVNVQAPTTEEVTLRWATL